MLTGRVPCPKARLDTGTVLLLFPAAILIMMVLGALVVDVSLSQVRARELAAVADSAANDALASLDVAHLRTNGEIRLDPDRAATIITQSIASGPLAEARIVDIAIGDDALGLTIAVTLELEVRFIMAPALPGDLDSTTITRTGRVRILG